MKRRLIDANALKQELITKKLHYISIYALCDIIDNQPSVVCSADLAESKAKNKTKKVNK